MNKQRETTQFLAPVAVEHTAAGRYDIYPTFPMQSGEVKIGMDKLASELSTSRRIVVDGYVGVFWDEIAKQLRTAFEAQGKSVKVELTADYMKASSEIDQMLAPYLNGDDPLFGYVTDLTLRDWFRPEFFELADRAPQADVELIVGCGAALADSEAMLVYVDLPKNELQFRARAKAARNLGSDKDLDNKQTYKRFYFVDWIVLNHHKRQEIGRIGYMVDGQHVENTPYTSGEALRGCLERMSKNFFRVRPWFEPGAWGGTWMRKHIDQLNKEVPNLAWSFELMVLENGLLLEGDGNMLEISFDTLMFAQHQNVLGKSAQRFKYDFPIRFDFLDTFDGGNLSVQCHPRPAYIKEKFGMPFTQDETYYILDCQNNPQVYLGFQQGIDPAAFEQALQTSQREAKAIDIEKYVRKIPAKKHDLFLIPNGTIHASGSDNLVLEISSAPYIFTFKMYDWMRLDLDGKPRPINIDHGMKNLYFERQGEKVDQELISHPYVDQKSESYTREHLPTHATQFYDIFRYTLPKQMEVACEGHAQVWMVVEGESVVVQTADGMRQRFNYAETFVIPAAAERYTIINESKGAAMLVMSQVKNEHI